MKNPPQPSPAAQPPGTTPSIDDEQTGLPGFRRWSSVYGFVLAFFAIVVVLLWSVSKAFS